MNRRHTNPDERKTMRRGSVRLLEAGLLAFAAAAFLAAGQPDARPHGSHASAIREVPLSGEARGAREMLDALYRRADRTRP